MSTKLDETTKASLLAAAEAQQAKKAALAEEHAVIQARKNDPTFHSLAKELKDVRVQKQQVKDEQIEKQAHAVYNSAAADIAAAALKKQEERQALAEEQAVMKQRAQDPTTFALKSELKTIVAEKEFKHNNEAAKAAIAERDAKVPVIAEVLKAVKKDE